MAYVILHLLRLSFLDRDPHRESTDGASASVLPGVVGHRFPASLECAPDWRRRWCSNVTAAAAAAAGVMYYTYPKAVNGLAVVFLALFIQQCRTPT